MTAEKLRQLMELIDNYYGKPTSRPRWTMTKNFPSNISLSPGNRAFLLI